jgi:hypothetical protein
VSIPGITKYIGEWRDPDGTKGWIIRVRHEHSRRSLFMLDGLIEYSDGILILIVLLNAKAHERGAANESYKQQSYDIIPAPSFAQPRYRETLNAKLKSRRGLCSPRQVAVVAAIEAHP